MNYFYHLGIFFAVYMVLAVGLNILVGYCGRLSLTHVVFFGVGAYAYAYASLHLGWGLAGGVLLGVVVTIPLAFCLVLASHPHHGDDYVLISLALQTLAYSIMMNWYDTSRRFGTLTSFTNGPFGASGMPRPAWLDSSLFRIAMVSLFISLLLTALSAIALTGPWGRVLRAARDNEAAAASLGNDVFRLHLESVLLASILASIAGCLYALYVSYVDPAICSLEQAVLVLSMVVVGGVGNLRGPIVGALLLIALPELLRFLPLSGGHIESIRVMFYGGALVAVMHFRPQGLAGAYRLR